jgi:WD40 repeat protein
VNAHNNPINCLCAIDDQYFATGAAKEVKVWKFYECVQVIPNAHQNTILSMKTLRVMNHQERALEFMLATGSKDKHVRLWSLKQFLQAGAEDQISQPNRIRQISDVTLSHYSQVNTIE